MSAVAPSLSAIARSYFDRLARQFPVQCASDEFYFFPRARAAFQCMDRLEDLDADRVEEALSFVRRSLGKVERFAPKDLEAELDRRLLLQSMRGFLREYGRKRVHRTDPSLYLKVSVLGCLQVLSIRRFSDRTRGRSLQARLRAVPRLFRQARQNLSQTLPEADSVFPEVFGRSLRFFKGLARSRRWPEASEALESLEDFGAWAGRLPVAPPELSGRQELECVLKESYGYGKSPQEILELLLKEESRLRRGQRTLEGLGSELNKNFSGGVWWYRKEVSRLKNFWQGQQIVDLSAFPLLVEETPSVLEPFRVSASYQSALGDPRRERAYFYVPPSLRSPSPFDAVLTAAHETYPGHHVLDSLRFFRRNPIRSQVESVLFYEGWACYAERWLQELGYFGKVRLDALQNRRELWRVYRALWDVGRALGKIRFEEMVERFRGLGRSLKEARLEVGRYGLSCGYQLCYFLGSYEIRRLREIFEGRLGMKGFHRRLLEGGQLPFEGVERRLAAQ